MTFESEQNQQDQGAAGEGGGADDLSGVLGAQDSTFITGEEKKPLNTGTLVMAGFLVACGIGTYVMYTRTAPAETAPTAEAAAAEATVTQFLNNDKANAAKMADLLENTQKAVEQFRASPGKKQIPIDELETNPFRLDLGVAEGDDGGAGSGPANEAAAAKRKAEEAEATLKAAQALNLQFIVSGRKKSCMINNAKYVEGQAVGEFTVETIGATTVVVRKGEGRFELKMK